MKLNLGVLDVSYAGSSGSNSAITTSEVAKILEDRYSVMETFYESRKDKIGEWLAESVGDAVDAVVFGDHVEPFLDATQRIESAFRDFLSADEMSKMLAGLTESERDYFLSSTGGFNGASLRGINHRKKHPFSKKNKARPAFVDTGLYRSSFRSWVSEA